MATLRCLTCISSALSLTLNQLSYLPTSHNTALKETQPVTRTLCIAGTTDAQRKTSDRVIDTSVCHTAACLTAELGRLFTPPAREVGATGTLKVVDSVCAGATVQTRLGLALICTQRGKVHSCGLKSQGSTLDPPKKKTPM